MASFGVIPKTPSSKLRLFVDKIHLKHPVTKFKIDKGEIDKLILEEKTFSDNFDEIYSQSIDNAYLPIVEIIKAYREISCLVNKLPFERIARRNLIELNDS